LSCRCQCYQVFLVQNAEPERGFSGLNRIMTDEKTCLDVQTTDSRLRVYLNGPPLSDTKAASELINRCYTRWMRSRKRNAQLSHTGPRQKTAKKTTGLEQIEGAAAASTLSTGAGRVEAGHPSLNLADFELGSSWSVSAPQKKITADHYKNKKIAVFFGALDAKWVLGKITKVSKLAPEDSASESQIKANKKKRKLAVLLDETDGSEPCTKSITVSMRTYGTGGSEWWCTLEKKA
jgi:hypothetical protein